MLLRLLLPFRRCVEEGEEEDNGSTNNDDDNDNESDDDDNDSSTPSSLPPRVLPPMGLSVSVVLPNGIPIRRSSWKDRTDNPLLILS